MSKLVRTLKQALLGENEGIKNELQMLLTSMTANKTANSDDDSADVNDSIKTKTLGSNKDMETDVSTTPTPNLNTADMDTENPVANTPGADAAQVDDDSDANDMHTVVKKLSATEKHRTPDDNPSPPPPSDPPEETQAKTPVTPAFIGPKNQLITATSVTTTRAGNDV